ncbi:hypothetical protein [Streptomyces alkaliphilus]|uniref:hypothetical protein n=1 Tax=Streptomyces alkaliphilus TaxID=1472722 RepID=UPI00117F8CB0|nr:hypothetical protein [Streptomyces alkaliphilus]MQS09893.1 hypothetical protein [Streptomyces alkaliphilus]
MVAADRGDTLISRLIHRAHAEPGWFLGAAACALVEADRARPGTADRLAALPGLVVLPLDPVAVPAVARGRDWADAHTEWAALPVPERPDGAVVVTVRPEVWRGRPVRVLDLGRGDVEGRSADPGDRAL